MKNLMVLFLGAVVFFGCSRGPKMSQITEVVEQVSHYKEAGVPDQITGPAESAINNARNARLQGNGTAARKYYREALKYVEDAEEALETAADSLRPEIVQKLSALDAEAEKHLSGLHLEAYETQKAEVEELLDINHVYRAERSAENLEEELASLREQQEHADSIASKIIGRWVHRDTASSEIHEEIDAITVQTIEFTSDGRARYRNKKDGQINEHEKMFYEFIDKGTYDIKGDTVHIFVDTFETVRKRMEVLRDGEWDTIVDEDPQVEEITDGSQDVPVTYTTLDLDFTKQ
jgi:hypothetical protein